MPFTFSSRVEKQMKPPISPKGRSRHWKVADNLGSDFLAALVGGDQVQAATRYQVMDNLVPHFEGAAWSQLIAARKEFGKRLQRGTPPQALPKIQSATSQGAKVTTRWCSIQTVEQ